MPYLQVLEPVGSAAAEVMRLASKQALSNLPDGNISAEEAKIKISRTTR